MPKHIYTNFEAIASFYHEHTSICSFVICLKRLTFSDKNLYFLLLDIWKKMNTGSNGLSYVQISLIEFKSVLKN